MKLTKILREVMTEIGDTSAGQFPFTSKTKAIQQEAQRVIAGIKREVKDRAKWNTDDYGDPNFWKGMADAGKTFIYDVKGSSKLRYLIEIDWDITYRDRKGDQDYFTTWARIDFDVKGNEGEVTDTNAREQYKLMSTIVAIFVEFANAVEPMAPLDSADFFAKADESQDKTINSRRAKLYGQYIEKNLSKLPGEWTVKKNKDRGAIEIKRKIKTKKESIKEIGDASKKPYGPIDTLTDDEAERQYGFSTDSGTIYEVKVETFYRGEGKPVIARVQFGIIDEDGEVSYDAQTGENEVYRVMSTILEIVKKDLKDNHADIIEFTPSKRAGGNKDKESMSNVRTQLYSRYIKSKWPNAEVTKSLRGDIKVILNP